MDRASQFAVACAREVLASAGLTPQTVPPERTGVSIGCPVGWPGSDARPSDRRA